MSFPEDLLEQAFHLARREPKRPRQASLRRAVSTTYYALFHLLIEEAVRNWKRPRERYALARMFEHQNMSSVCRSCRDNLTSRLARATAVETGIHRIADTFATMQQRRHTADYDSSFRWTRTQAIEAVESVEGAVASWKAIRHETTAQDFLVTLLIKERKRQ